MIKAVKEHLTKVKRNRYSSFTLGGKPWCEKKKQITYYQTTRTQKCKIQTCDILKKKIKKTKKKHFCQGIKTINILLHCLNEADSAMHFIIFDKFFRFFSCDRLYHRHLVTIYNSIKFIGSF